MYPYRLEMGTKMKNENGKNLYEFWGNKITTSINALAKKSNSKELLCFTTYKKSMLFNTKHCNKINPIAEPIFFKILLI